MRRLDRRPAIAELVRGRGEPGGSRSVVRAECLRSVVSSRLFWARFGMGCKQRGEVGQEHDPPFESIGESRKSRARRLKPAATLRLAGTLVLPRCTGIAAARHSPCHTGSSGLVAHAEVAFLIQFLRTERPRTEVRAECPRSYGERISPSIMSKRRPRTFSDAVRRAQCSNSLVTQARTLGTESAVSMENCEGTYMSSW